MADHTYAYLLADADTIRVIQQLKASASTARDELAQFIGALTCEDGTPAGGTVIYNDQHDTLSFSFEGGKLPRGWHMKPNTAGAPSPYPVPPNHYNEEADLARTKILSCARRQSLQSIFNDCCIARSGTSPHSLQKYAFEEIGDKIVVICPPTPQANTFVVPIGCTEISYVDYLKMKEEIAPPPPRVLKTFSAPLRAP